MSISPAQRFYDKYRINEYISSFNELASKGLYEEIDKIKNEYIDSLNKEVDSIPFEELVTLLMTLSNMDTDLSNGLLATANENVLRATLLIEFFNTNLPELIKNDPEEATNRAYHYAKENEGTQSADDHFRMFHVKYKILSQMLKNVDIKKINKNLMDDLKKFASRFSNVDSYFFFDPFGNFLTNKKRVIDSMFSSPFIDIRTLQELYDDVLLKNKYLKATSFDSIIINGRNLETKIKGLYRKCGYKYFERYFYNDKKMPNSGYELLNNKIKEIIELNKDDEEGLLLFFGKIEKYGSKDIKDYLKQFDYYEKYGSDKLNELFDNTIAKLLDGDCNINQEVLEALGSYKGFLDKYDLILNLFYNSKDDKFKQVIMLPLIHGLIEKENEKYGLNVNIEYRRNLISYGSLGSYSSSDNRIFINPYIFEVFDDKDDSFVKSVNTVFHEMRHACQEMIIKREDSFNYDNLLMAMEGVISSGDDDYYRKNYWDISYERDARDYAYVDTMSFFREMPEYQKHVEEESKKREITDYIKLDQYDKYTTIIDYFCSRVKRAMEIVGEIPEFRAIYFENLKKYPVLFKFFDIDIENGIVAPKSDEYFEEQLRILESKSDSLRKREEIFAIKNFLYAIKIGKSNVLKDKKESDLLSDVEREVFENVGPRPNR